MSGYSLHVYYYLTWMLWNYLQSGLQRLKDFPQPFWLALFVEGTRFTKAKLLAAQEYAASAGLPVPRNVLIPRTKVKISWVFCFLVHYFLFTTKEAYTVDFFYFFVFSGMSLRHPSHLRRDLNLKILCYWSSIFSISMFNWCIISY